MAILTVGYGKTYSTYVAAYAAANAGGGDTIELYRSTLTGLTEYGAVVSYTKGITVRGMDPGIRIMFNDAATTYTGVDQDYHFDNVFLDRYEANISAAIYSSNFTWSNCFINGYNRIIIGSTTLTGTFRFYNCVWLNEFSSLSRINLHVNCGAVGSKVQIWNCSVESICKDGYDRGFISINSANPEVEIYNTKMIYTTANFYTGTTFFSKLTYDYCEFPTSNTSGNPGANNTVRNVQDMGFSFNEDGCIAAAVDLRTIKSFQLPGTTTPNGVDITAIFDTDICGTSRPATGDGYCRGCSYNFDIISNADFPEPENVLTADTTDNEPGLWTIANSTKYQKDETYGVNGTSEVGTYDPSETPGIPTLTSVTPGNGVFTANVTTVETTDFFQIFYKKKSEQSWTIDPQTNEGSGSITITGVDNFVAYDVFAIVDNGGCVSLPSNMLTVTPSDGTATNPMIDAAEAIKDMLNDATFQESFTATREYITYKRLSKITELTVFVSPTEREVEAITRGEDQNIIGTSVIIINKVQTKEDTDALMTLSEEIYRTIKRGNLTGLEGYGISGVESPTIYSEDQLATAHLFAAEITFNVKVAY